METPACDAVITDPNKLAYYAPAQRIVAHASKPCSRKGVEQVGPLCLCKVHARMAREGLVSENGTVATKADLANVRKYPAKFPNGLYTWVKEAK